MSDAAFPLIQTLTADEAHAQAAALGAVLADCVAGGASVNFMHPFSPAQGESFYREIAESVAAGNTVLLAAWLDGRIVGTVQVQFVLKPNQLHRADIAKMLVNRSARRRGIGAALMRAAEAESLKAGRWLAVLDTATGGEAEQLYRKLGWRECGVIPDYALWPAGGCAARPSFISGSRLEGPSSNRLGAPSRFAPLPAGTAITVSESFSDRAQILARFGKMPAPSD